MAHKFHIWIFAATALLASAPLTAGVVYEIEVTNHDHPGRGPDQVQTSLQDGQLKMQFASKDEKGEMIFRGGEQEMIMVDHDERSYTVIDQQTLAEIGEQLNQVNQQMAEALKNVPPEQRAMVERMMRERMPQMQAAPPPRASTELVNTGERDTFNGYPCVKYDVRQDGRKVRELWVTDWDNVEGGEEVVDVFRQMSEFMQEMLASLAKLGPGAAAVAEDNLFEYMNQLDGFPVVTREFSSRGELTTESTLRSAEARALDPAEFEPPAGYKARSLMPR